MSLVRNERTKLIATGLNNIAVATLIAGLIAPFSGFLYGTANPVGSHPWALIGCGWLFCSFTLHVCAQWILGKLLP